MTNEKTLKEMKAHMELYLDYIMDAGDKGDPYFDIKFEIMGKSFTLSSNADLYSDLESLVKNQIEED